MSSNATPGVAPAQAGLQGLALQAAYRTGKHDLINEFYNPCLARASRYDRATGYFDTRAFEFAAAGLAELLTNGGQIRLVVSPRLRRADVTALAGERAPSRDWTDTIQSSSSSATELAEWLRADRRGCTSWLVRTGKLETRVAFRAPDCAIPFSHYHEKAGLFTDANGDRVAFAGSINETGMAWTGNFESIDVFRGWRRDDARRVATKGDAFEALWRNETPGVVVKPIGDARKDGLGLRHVWNAVRASVARPKRC